MLFADEMADRWPRLANRGPVFDRKSLIDAMIVGGIPRMLETRQYRRASWRAMTTTTVP
ncbi:hypothetical protein [Sphingomonas sp.]|uniref:hypothetical protein n=1 Tax=Sphingomonas sp. TaxID=28214 RepID=UPI00286D374F|nr:hypothetical protein [Sphingomonas sp.]